MDRGGTVLMSTHTLEVAETMCDRIAIIHGGKIVAHGTMAEVQEQTSSEDLGPGGSFPQADRRDAGSSARYDSRRLTA